MTSSMTGSKEEGPVCVLMAYVDDATGEVFARFYEYEEYEGTISAMDSFKRYIIRYGIPQKEKSCLPQLLKTGHFYFGLTQNE
jgi:hypothetical protein